MRLEYQLWLTMFASLHLASGQPITTCTVCTTAVSGRIRGPCQPELRASLTGLSCVAQHPDNPSPHVSSSPQPTWSSKSQMLSPIREALQGPDAKWDKFTCIRLWCMCWTLYHYPKLSCWELLSLNSHELQVSLHIYLILGLLAVSLKSRFCMCLEYVYKTAQGGSWWRMKWPRIMHHSFPLCYSESMETEAIKTDVVFG